MSGGMLSPAGIETQAEFLAGVWWFREEVGTLSPDDFERWLADGIERWSVTAPRLEGVDRFDQLASSSAIARRAWELCGGRR